MQQKLGFIAILLFLSFNVFAVTNTKPNCTIKGTIEGDAKGTVFIRNLMMPTLDTIKYDNGTFTYKTYVKEPLPFLLIDEQNKYQLFFVEPDATIQVKLNRKEMQVLSLTGSKSHDTFRELINKQDPIQKLAQQVQQNYTNPNLNKDSLNYVINVINGELRKNFYDFLKKYNTSEVSSFIVYSSVSNDRNIQVNSADTMYQFLQGKAKTCFYGIELNKMLSKLKSVNVGYMVPDFTLPDSTGVKKYTLSKVVSQNKYVLIDFWASWCGPCKNEIPFLKEAYTKFHSKGFEIMSVSLDDKKQAWQNALNQFQMPWIQISDVKGFSSVVNDLYHVPSIPKTLLLDNTGKIIATDLRGTALDKKLEELLK